MSGPLVTPSFGFFIPNKNLANSYSVYTFAMLDAMDVRLAYQMIPVPCISLAVFESQRQSVPRLPFALTVGLSQCGLEKTGVVGDR